MMSLHTFHQSYGSLGAPWIGMSLQITSQTSLSTRFKRNLRCSIQSTYISSHARGCST